MKVVTHRFGSASHVVAVKSRKAAVMRPKRGYYVTLSASNQQSSKSKAEAAVEKGLELFGVGEAEKALEQFLLAQQLNGNRDEMCAAVYNSSCAYVKLKRWNDAADALERAINDYDVKLVVALKDQDLAPLRDRKEWNELLGRVSGGMGNEGFAKLRAEASSPFQLVRTFLFGGLAAGASLGVIVSTARLLAAFGGVYELEETLKTFGINVVCLAVLGALFVRELQSRDKSVQMAAKEEDLAMLQVSVSKDGERSVPLAAFRGMYRPIIVAGSKGQVKKSMSQAARYSNELTARGIVVIPVVLNTEDIDEKIEQLKSDPSFATSSEKDAAQKGFGSPAKATSSDSVTMPESKKWKLLPYDVDEWRKWIQGLGIDDSGAKTEIYAQIQLDGVVRSSGIGAPPFEKLLEDIPVLDSIQTRFSDGRGMKSS